MARFPFSPSRRWLSPLIGLALLAALACGGGGGSSAVSPAQPPVITASSLPSARAGASLTLSGSGFQGTSQVLFGTLPATSWSPSVDGTQLQVKVPMGGTGTVNLSVTTPAGTSAGPAFTFLAAPAPTSTFSPTLGGPGTKVVVTGSGFIGTDQVVFGGTAATSKASADGTTLTAWAPDMAPGQTPGPVDLTVRTVSAGSISVGSFSYLAPRLALLSQPFVEVLPPVPSITSREFDYPSGHRTDQYGMSFPQAPVLHPYNPDQYGTDVRNDATGVPMLAPRMTLNIQFPTVFREVLPASVLQQIQASGVSLDNVSILCYSQNYFWDGSNPYEFRPHYYTDPNAPYSGSYNETSNLSLGLFEAENGISLVDAQGSAFFGTQVIVHNETVAPNLVVSSPDSLQMPGINVANSTSFWSLVVDGTNAAATLHLLLNDGDQARLEAIMDQPAAPITLQQLAQGLQADVAADTVSNPRVVAQASAMFGPLVNGALLGAAAADGSATLTLFGSGFTGATAVTAGTANQAGSSLQVVSDSTLTVTVPQAAAAQGNLIVTTAFGASQPAALN
jgi:hypothetical protein